MEYFPTPEPKCNFALNPRVGKGKEQVWIPGRSLSPRYTVLLYIRQSVPRERLPGVNPSHCAARANNHLGAFSAPRTQGRNCLPLGLGPPCHKRIYFAKYIYTVYAVYTPEYIHVCDGRLLDMIVGLPKHKTRQNFGLTDRSRLSTTEPGVRCTTAYTFLRSKNMDTNKLNMFPHSKATTAGKGKSTIL